MSKFFILGLPRTGTTSLCHFLLQHGFNVAHTAYTQAAFNQADVIADTPVFSDFYELNRYFPDSYWIYLHRSISEWIPSITTMLDKLRSQPKDRFHPLIMRSFERVFGPLDHQDLLTPEHLNHCYKQHAFIVDQVARQLNKPLISVQLTRDSDNSHNAEFLYLIQQKPENTFSVLKESQKPIVISTQILNQQGKISAWQQLKHERKIPSHLADQGRRVFFDYSPELSFKNFNAKD